MSVEKTKSWREKTNRNSSINNIGSTDKVIMESSLLFRNIVSFNLRKFSTSCVCNGKKNFRQLALYNFRGGQGFRNRQKALSKVDPDIPYYTYGVREPGYEKDDKFHFVPEMVPEIIVPDLTGFDLKPYVSYRASDIIQDEFTAKDLFDAVYSTKIINDFKKGELDEKGNPKNPNKCEKLTSEEAMVQARKTGTDLF